MKRLWCWMILLAACAMPAAAQNLMLKVGGGLASHYKDCRPVGAFKLGLGYEFELDQHWTVEPSLVFYGKGWKEPDEQVAIRDDEGEQLYDEEGNPLVGVRSTSATANYIELPVVVHYIDARIGIIVQCHLWNFLLQRELQSCLHRYTQRLLHGLWQQSRIVDSLPVQAVQPFLSFVSGII